MASEDLLKKAVAAFNALSPEQQAEMLEEQRQSWVRGNVGLSRDERGMTTPVAPVSSEPFEDNTLELARRILGADTGLTINPLPRCEGPQNVRPRYAIWGDDLEALAKAALKSVAPVSPDATGKCGELVANVWALVKPDGNLVEVTRYASMANLWRERGYHPAEYVTRSQAVELLAAERAEKEEAREAWKEAVAMYDQEKARVDPAMKRVSDLEADNAALTARVKELEADVKREAQSSTHNAQDCLDEQLRAEALEAKLAAAEKIAFEHGYVLACCNIVNLHDEPTIAHCTLSELGVTRAAVKEMNLSEYDLKALRKIEGGCSGSPYAKTKRKVRAAQGGKPS